LLSLQAPQRALEIAWILDLIAVLECGETVNTDFYADSLSGRRHWLVSGRPANDQSIPAVNTARNAKLLASSFNRAGEAEATAIGAWNREFVAFDRARPSLLVFLRESVIAVFAL